MQLQDLVNLDQDALRRPADVYTRLRERGVHYAPEVDAYVVSRHEDVSRVLRDGRRYSSSIAVGSRPPGSDDDPDALRPLLLLSDGPEHARRRSIVNRAFTAAKVASWEPRIRQLCLRHLDAMRTSDHVDLVRDLAAPLPIRVISMLLGVPQEDVDDFRLWSERITSSLGGHHGDPDERARVQQAFTSYITRLLDEPDRHPEGGVLATIAAAEAAGELNRRQCVNFVIELLVAGNITTTHHLASSMLLLATHEALWQRLADQPSLVPRFVEESLRLESPIQAFYRLAMEDSEIGGTLVPADSRVLVLYAGANRDPHAWERCPHMKLDRPNAAAHLAFGKGSHACLGASLARLESKVVLECLLERLDGFELLVGHAKLPYLPSFINHGPTALPARLTFREPAVAAPTT